jgi:hypothetical protein
MDFERTDAGVVVTINDKVSGMCGKFHPTSFPVLSSSDDPMSVSFTMLPVRAGAWPEELTSVFQAPSGIGSFSPFLTQYDTYCLSFDEIMGRVE